MPTANDMTVRGIPDDVWAWMRANRTMDKTLNDIAIEAMTELMHHRTRHDREDEQVLGAQGDTGRG